MDQNKGNLAAIADLDLQEVPNYGTTFVAGNHFFPRLIGGERKRGVCLLKARCITQSDTLFMTSYSKEEAKLEEITQ